MKVLVGMSGGLDSSYAVVKLREMGYDVEGAVVKMHPYTETDEAYRVAAELGVPIHEINAEHAFECSVISNFINEYRKGRTPNPCVICNSEIKFRLLYDYAMEHGFDKIATGHYADIAKVTVNGEVRYAVKQSADSKKDQSYMLWRLPQKILKCLVFPLYNETKNGVKDKDISELRSVAQRPESQEICFIPDNDYAAFIESRIGNSVPGDFISPDGKKLGEHKGIIHYTVGQRKGLGISLGERAFITEINAENNTITLDTADSHLDKFYVTDMVFSGIPEPNIGNKLQFKVKHRYLATPTDADVIYLGNGTAEVHLCFSARAVTPGQSAVFYSDGTVAAGGFISLVQP